MKWDEALSECDGCEEENWCKALWFNKQGKQVSKYSQAEWDPNSVFEWNVMCIFIYSRCISTHLFVPVIH